MNRNGFNLKDLKKIGADQFGATYETVSGEKIRLPNQRIDFGRSAKSSFKQNKRKGL